MSALSSEYLKEYNRKIQTGEVERPVQKTPLEKQKENPTSLRKCITAFCWMCVGESRKDVTNCTSKQCPLYSVRPWQGKEQDTNEDQE